MGPFVTVGCIWLSWSVGTCSRRSIGGGASYWTLNESDGTQTTQVRKCRWTQASAPGHAPELLLNNPSRLGTWCRRMRDLCLLVEHDPQCQFPVSPCPTCTLSYQNRLQSVSGGGF